MSPQGRQHDDNNNSSIQIDYFARDAVEEMLMSSSSLSFSGSSLDEQQQQLSEDNYCMPANHLAELRSLPGNDVCIDCGEEDPDWASVNLGVFLCLACSGQHRSLGTHISFVRSIRMDSWSEQQLQKMKSSGGNEIVVAFLKQHGLKKHHSIRERYEGAPALLWQQKLDARVKGLEEPTELPTVSIKSPNGAGVRKERMTKMAGFGSTHHLDASSSHHSTSSSKPTKRQSSAPPLINPLFDKAFDLVLSLSQGRGNRP